MGCAGSKEAPASQPVKPQSNGSAAALAKPQPMAHTNGVSVLAPAPEQKPQPAGPPGAEDAAGMVPPSISGPETQAGVGAEGQQISGPVAVTAGGWCSIRRDVETQENEKLAQITSLACTVLKVPIALVVTREDKRTVVSSAQGLPHGSQGWLSPFCLWSMAQDGAPLLAIEDTSADSRTKDCSWVTGPPKLAYYAGVPLMMTDGTRTGTLCVADVVPRSDLGATAFMLTNLGGMAMNEVLALRRQMKEAEEQAPLLRGMDTYWDGSVLVGTHTPKWNIIYCNEAFTRITGVTRAIVKGKCWWDIFELPSGSKQAWKKYEENVHRWEGFDAIIILREEYSNARPKSVASSGGGSRRFKLSMRPHSTSTQREYGLMEDEDAIHGQYFAVVAPVAQRINTAGSNVSGGLDIDSLPFDEPIEIGPILGKGSFGYVYKAATANKVVAVKVIEAEEVWKMDANGNPLEASLTFDLKHPNIVETYQYGTRIKTTGGSSGMERAGSTNLGHGSRRMSTSVETPMRSRLLDSTGPVTPAEPRTVIETWLMLEYCDAGSVMDAIDRGAFHETAQALQQPVPKMAVIVGTARDIASAMAFLHSHNILHGDLTAGNILCASKSPTDEDVRDFTAKVADFGLSRQSMSSKVETNTYGTVTHMPPELLNEGHLSKACDVYAFGVLLWEMYCGQRVWSGLRHPQIIHTIAVQKRHAALPPGTPADFQALAYRCMAAVPTERPTFTEILKIMDEMAL